MMESAVPMADVGLTDYLSSRRSNNLRISQPLLNSFRSLEETAFGMGDPGAGIGTAPEKSSRGLVAGLFGSAGEAHRNRYVRGGQRRSHEGDGEDGECDKAFHYFWLLFSWKLNLSRTTDTVVGKTPQSGLFGPDFRLLEQLVG